MKNKNIFFKLELILIATTVIVAVTACADNLASAEYEIALKGKSLLIGEIKENISCMTAVQHRAPEIKAEDLQNFVPQNTRLNALTQPMCGTLSPETTLKIIKQDTGKESKE